MDRHGDRDVHGSITRLAWFQRVDSVFLRKTTRPAMVRHLSACGGHEKHEGKREVLDRGLRPLRRASRRGPVLGFGVNGELCSDLR